MVGGGMVCSVGCGGGGDGDGGGGGGGAERARRAYELGIGTYL